MKRIDDLEVAGQRVLLRADLNVPLDGERITDDGRIQASLPVISKLAGRGARVIICAHLGRPKGDGYAARAAGGPSLRPVAARLGELLGQPVAFATDVAGQEAAATAAGLADGEVALLENVRFEPAETSQDDAERAELAGRWPGWPRCTWATDSARCTASTPACTTCPGCSRTPPGTWSSPRSSVLRQLTTDPPRPYVVVLGGAKPSDKLAVIGNLLGKADRLIIVGGMSYTFLAAQGYEVGQSLLEADQIPQVSAVLAEAEKRGVDVVLPVDLVAADRFAPDADHRVVRVGEFPPDRESLDMGPATRALFTQKLADAKTVFWNGPACSSSRRSRPAPGRWPRRSAR